MSLPGRRTWRSALPGGDGFLGLLCLGGLRGGLARFGGLRAKSLGEAIHAALSVDQLLAAREERMAVVADFEVQLRFGGPGLPRRAARAARLDVVVLRMNPFLHSSLLGACGKTTVYHTPPPRLL